MAFRGGGAIEEALLALGDQLASRGSNAALVVVGGATLNVLGIVERATGDVDVIARAIRDDGEPLRLIPAEPFPEPLQLAIRTVARDLGLAEEWMNAVIGKQWRQGLPPTIYHDITWRRYQALEVGFVGRRTLIALKLFAAVDRGPESVHVRDLFALAPTDEELDEAAQWVETQDASSGFSAFVQEATAYVRRERQQHR